MKKSNQPYSPPFEITPEIVDLIERIGESLGRLSLDESHSPTSRLRRETRIQSIQASLQIEGNTLSLEQVTAVLDGKRVLGSPREIQEVRNAFAAYEQLENLAPESRKDLCLAHAILMNGLLDDPGTFRRDSVGIQRGADVVHIAPPADRVFFLVDDLLGWLADTKAHPLIASSVFHYELEFIHPFMDGNGRLGRLWQTLILGHCNDLFYMIPIESIIRDRQPAYYSALRQSDESGNSTSFVEFLLDAMLDACRQLTGEVKKLLMALTTPMSRKELQEHLGLKSQANFRERYLQPALTAGLTEMTIPDKPQSRQQQYRLTRKGKLTLEKLIYMK